MSREYVFFQDTCLIDICKDGHTPVLNSNCKTFLWDENISGITIRQEVYSEGDSDEEKKVRIGLVVIRDDDCREFCRAASRYKEWKYRKGNVSPSIEVGEGVYEMVAGMYAEDFLNLSKEIMKKILFRADFDYAMPVGQSQDVLTLTVPVKCSMLEPDTLYRVGILEEGSLPTTALYWPSFELFRPDVPVGDIFIPYSAYLKVRKQLRGGVLCFDNAYKYRHYQDFFSDIHFDRLCMEVEVNPALVCFELEVRCGKDNLPFFYIVISSEEKVLNRYPCRLLDVEGTGRIIACCPLSTNEIHITDYRKVTASLEAFDLTIARFTFFTDKTERGEVKLKRCL